MNFVTVHKGGFWITILELHESLLRLMNRCKNFVNLKYISNVTDILMPGNTQNFGHTLVYYKKSIMYALCEYIIISLYHLIY